jgi:hypothetical protein
MERILSVSILLSATCTGLFAISADAASQRNSGVPEFLSKPLVSHIYTADPAVHVFNDMLYVYTSHDIDAGIQNNGDGNQYAMRNYHVFSMEEVGGFGRPMLLMRMENTICISQ